MTIEKYDIVTVTKKTRSKTKNGFYKAEVGKTYLVTSVYRYQQNYGRSCVTSTKVFLCDEEGNNNYISTDACLERLYNLNSFKITRNTEVDKWLNVRKAWMDKTYVPLIMWHRYGYDGFPITSSKDGNAVLVSPFNNKDEKVWLSRDHVHVDDINTAFSSSLEPNGDLKNSLSEAFTVRVAEWIYKKMKK